MGCFVCGDYNTEKHHIIKRSQCKALIKCDLNLVELCPAHHRGHNGVHGKNGHALDIKLKKKFEKKLRKLFTTEIITVEEIKEKLGITEVCANRLIKNVQIYKEGYNTEEVIKNCLGGRFYL